jgi:hypothetical protein
MMYPATPWIASWTASSLLEGNLYMQPSTVIVSMRPSHRNHALHLRQIARLLLYSVQMECGRTCMLSGSTCPAFILKKRLCTTYTLLAPVGRTCGNIWQADHESDGHLLFESSKGLIFQAYLSEFAAVQSYCIYLICPCSCNAAYIHSFLQAALLYLPNASM